MFFKILTNGNEASQQTFPENGDNQTPSNISKKHLVSKHHLPWFEVSAGHETSPCTRNQLKGDRGGVTRVEKMPERSHIITITIFGFIVYW